MPSRTFFSRGFCDYQNVRFGQKFDFSIIYIYIKYFCAILTSSQEALWRRSRFVPKPYCRLGQRDNGPPVTYFTIRTYSKTTNGFFLVTILLVFLKYQTSDGFSRRNAIYTQRAPCVHGRIERVHYYLFSVSTRNRFLHARAHNVWVTRSRAAPRRHWRTAIRFGVKFCGGIVEGRALEEYYPKNISTTLLRVGTRPFAYDNEQYALFGLLISESTKKKHISFTEKITVVVQ